FKFKPDLTHTNFIIPGALSRFACKVLRKGKVVSTRHELKQSMNPLLKWLEKRTAVYADHIVHISKVVEESYSKTSASSTTIHNGIDLKYIESLKHGKSIIKPLSIVCLGRMVPVKGQSVLVEAIPHVINKHPGVSVTFIGSGEDEFMLKNKVKSLNLIEKFTFKGWMERDKAMHLIASSNLMVVPTGAEQEGFGLAIIEGLAMETPLISSNIPIFREVAGDSARMFKTGDSQSLANAIIDVFENPAAAQSRSTQGKQRVMDKFTVDVMVDAYLNVYEQLFVNKSKKISG
ncbi:MAG: glycosyltransferase family 4 protein, partial [Psychromonas sp.]